LSGEFLEQRSGFGICAVDEMNDREVEGSKAHFGMT